MYQRSQGEKVFLLGLSLLIAVVITFGISQNIILLFSPTKNVLYLSFYILPIILASSYYGLAGGIIFATISAALAFVLARSASIPLEDAQVTGQIILYFLIGCFGGFMQRQNIQIQKALHVASITDELTGLYNYQHFRRRLNEEIKRAKRYGHPLALLLCDIDHFKQYNDTFGHPNGNFILNKMAMLLKDSIRDSDIPFRYGGDEFVLILPETEDDCLKAGERIIEKVNGAFASENIDPGLVPSLTAGVAYSDPKKPLTASQLISMADRALYEAKNAGKKIILISPEEA